MKRIAIFQCDLGVGGIQKSLVNLLKNLDYNRVQVDLYLSEKKNFWAVDFPKDVQVHYLPEIPRVFSFLPFDIGKKFVKLKFDADEYDLAIDFNSYQFSCALGALTVPAKKRVMWIHNDVAIKLKEEWKYRVLWNNFKGKFKYYDAFVPVSAALAEPFRTMSCITDKPFITIQNYIDVEAIRRQIEEGSDNVSPSAGEINLVAVGKLCHQKGYDIMLDLLHQACQKRNDLHLYIMGDGPDRETLEGQTKQLGLQNHVTFLGNRTNPFCIMNQMDAFISTSRYEGQPLNIMEAKVVGLPLYCTKNLEKYTEGLVGYDSIPDALSTIERTPKKPDDLKAYNQRIIESVIELADEGK